MCWTLSKACRTASMSRCRERGNSLSTGQKQLINFARALAFNPRILILDEATSSVDTDTELRIRGALERMVEGRTSVLIAHRLSTVQRADTILVMHKGAVARDGLAPGTARRSADFTGSSTSCSTRIRRSARSLRPPANPLLRPPPDCSLPDSTPPASLPNSASLRTSAIRPNCPPERIVRRCGRRSRRIRGCFSVVHEARRGQRPSRVAVKLDRPPFCIRTRFSRAAKTT